MVLWIDGPYGVGKSTLARAIRDEIPDSFLFDAELVGNAVRENLPPEVFYSETFEGYPLWFTVCAALLADLAGRFQGLILAPMTLMEPGSYEKIRQSLTARGIPLRRVMLEADRDAVRRRILLRGEAEDCWCMRHIDQCLAVQAGETCDLRLSTTGKTPEALARSVKAWLASGAPESR